MSVFPYSVSNFSKVKNTPSGREAMLLENKSLLGKKILEKMLLKNNISRWKYYTNKLNLRFYSRSLKNICFLLQRLQLL